MKKTFKLTPDLTCPELEGYKLPEMPNYQDGEIEGMAESQYGTDIDSIRGGNPYDLNKDLKSGFVRGYSKAREKYEFTLYDMAQAFAYGRTLEPFDSFDDFIASLRTPRIPIAIEVEMVEVKVSPMGRIVDPMDVGQNQSSCKWEQRPATQPDGTVKGVWVYE
jgi:hypothetical protein